MAFDKVVDSTALEAGLTQIATAIREKGGTTDVLAFPDAMVAAITAIQAGGGSSWTDNYSVFATGTFTPTENVAQCSIDTGVLFDSSNYLSQFLIIWREPDMITTSGFYIGTIRSLNKYNSAVHMGVVIGSSAGSNVASPLKTTDSSYPVDGGTTWTITGLSSSLTFRMGRTYRWILLGALK